MLFKFSLLVVLVYTCTAILPARRRLHIPGLTFMSPSVPRSYHSFTGSRFPRLQEPSTSRFSYRPRISISFGDRRRPYSNYHGNDFEYRDRYRFGGDDRYNSYNDRVDSYRDRDDSYSSRDFDRGYSDYRYRRPYMSQAIYRGSFGRRGYPMSPRTGRGFRGAQIGAGIYIPRRSSAAFGSYSSGLGRGLGRFSGGIGRFAGGLGRVSGGLGRFSGGLGRYRSSSFNHDSDDSGDYSDSYGRYSGGIGRYSGGLGRYSGGLGRYSGSLGRGFGRGIRYPGGGGYYRHGTNSYYRHDEDDD